MFSLKSFSRVVLTTSLVMALTPAVFSAGPVIERNFFPVTVGTQIANVTQHQEGISFYVRFRKLRQCEFLALAWYDGDVRVVVDFEPSANSAYATRPTGGQYAGPWLIRGVSDLDSSRAFVFHRCHPLWTTVTEFFAQT